MHSCLCSYLRGLGDILSVLRYNGYDLQAFNLPHEGVIVNGNSVDQMEAVIEADHAEALLNEEQKRISEEVLNSVEEAPLIAENNLTPRCTRMYFVDAPGGTGKHFYLIISETGPLDVATRSKLQHGLELQPNF